ncbi:MAG TPA: YceD family protein [Steroidobacteraceae bacterium]|nr:YceD family protein [Steroidobacteraceae bacterium]
MSTPPDRPIDVLGLARSGSSLERQFEVARFERLRDRLAAPEGHVNARADFATTGRWPVAKLVVKGELVLGCQRCLGPMRRGVASEADLVFAEEGAKELPEGYEPVEGDPRRLELATLVEDELLLSLPIIPQHGEGERCELPKDGGAAPGEGADTGLRRPFAGLKDLLEH